MGRVCAAFVGQLGVLAEPTGQQSRHGVGRLLFWTTDVLTTLGREARGKPLALGEHLRLREVAADDITERVIALMGSADTHTLARLLAPQVGELTAALGSSDLPKAVASDYGQVRLADYLRATTVLLVDLAFDTGGTAHVAAMAETVRALTGVLAQRFPGRTIEVRVPPYAAVQMGGRNDGPTHTRGTPPNVVETDPRTFLELAVARQSWTRAVAAGTLTHSGAHAPDAARAFPVFRLH